VPDVVENDTKVSINSQLTVVAYETHASSSMCVSQSFKETLKNFMTYAKHIEQGTSIPRQP